jgi:hypothetical protein
MHIGLYLDRSRCLRWHQWLAVALSDMPGCQVSLVFAPTAHPLPPLCGLALKLEHMIYGHRCRAEHAMDPIDAWGSEPPSASEDTQAGFDVVIDLIGRDGPLPRSQRVLTLLFNSAPGEIGAIAALLGDPPVRIEVHDSAFASAPLIALPAMADSGVLTIALDAVLSRAGELLLKALGRPLVSAVGVSHPLPPSQMPRNPAFSTTLSRVARVLNGKLISLVGRVATRGPTWAAAYRFDETASLLDSRQATFAVLRDDTRRYYSDPFPFQHRGRRYIFVEEFGFATGRGCISVAAIDANGMASPPRVIIEEPHHLSYPFVFKHDGEIWMIPESGAANRIDLYRAEQFPHRWRREGALLEGVSGYDATLLRHDGRLWLLASLTRWNSTSWDNLGIFHASSLTGAWIPHTQNPVLLDATNSRAGGALFRHNGELLRPAQDCSRIYGGALTFNRLDTLNETDFRQTEVGRIVSNTLGCHTYNRDAGLETIDIFGATRGLTQITASYSPSAGRAQAGAQRLPVNRELSQAQGMRP